MSGLQAWDASGRMVTDLGDFNMRYMGATSLNVGPGATAWNVGWGGMRTNGWIVVLNTSMYWNDYYCIPYNDYFTVQYLPTTAPYPEILYFEVYSFS